MINSPLVQRRSYFLGLAFDQLTLESAVDWVVQRSAENGFSYVVTPNVDHVVRLHNARTTDRDLHDAYRRADLVLCDSRILALVAKLRGKATSVVPGSDLTHKLIDGGGPWKSIAVVGGDRVLHARLKGLYPHYSWRFHEPPFGLSDDPLARRAIGEFVEQGPADLVFFAFGSPQSEICCLELKCQASACTTVLCVGASLEFLAGIKRRAPKWMQKCHLEWLYRLLAEPRRLWRRYLVEGPRIVSIAIRDRS